MKIKLTEKGRILAEKLEIPKDIKGRFESVFINDKYDENAIHIKCQEKGLTLCGRIPSNLNLTSNRFDVSCPMCIGLLKGLNKL